MRIEKSIRIPLEVNVDFTVNDAINVLADNFVVPSPIVNKERIGGNFVYVGPEVKNLPAELKDKPTGIYYIEDISYHGSPQYEVKLITSDPDKITVYKCLEYLYNKYIISK